MNTAGTSGVEQEGPVRNPRHWQSHRLAGFASVMLFVGLLPGCNTPGPNAEQAKNAETDNTPAPTLTVESLNLPTLGPGKLCPISQEVALPTLGVVVGGKPVPTYGYGRGPVYLSGQLVWHQGQLALLLTAPEYAGPVRARGARLDAPGDFPIQSQTGTLSLPARTKGSGWRMADAPLKPGLPPGCYGLEVDGTNFTEAIVFSVSSGPDPSG